MNKLNQQPPESVFVMTKDDGKSEKTISNLIKKKKIAAIIPLRAHVNGSIDQNEVLLRRCIDAVRSSKYISHIVVTADDAELLKQAEEFSDVIQILRPEHLSRPEVRVTQVLQYTLETLSNDGFYPDIIVPAEVTYPFRPDGLFDDIIEMLVRDEFETVIAGIAEYRSCWKKEKSGLRFIMDVSKPRKDRNPLYFGLPSLAAASLTTTIENGLRYGKKLGIYEVNDPFASIEIRTVEQLKKIADKLYWPI